MDGLTGAIPSSVLQVGGSLAAAQPAPDAAIERARLEYASGRFDAALRALEPLTQTTMPPAAAWSAWSLLARAAARAGRPDAGAAAARAVECFGAVTRDGAALPADQLTDAAIVFYLAGKPREAAALMGNDAAAGGSSAEAYLYAGLIQLALGNAEQAATVLMNFPAAADDDLQRRRFEALIEAFRTLGDARRKDLAESYAALGLLHYNANRFDQALPAIESALEIDPHYAFALALKADLLRVTGRPVEEALGLLQEALRLSPESAFAHAVYAEALAAMDRREDAAEAYKKAVGLDASVAQWHFRRGELLRQLQRLEDAVASFDVALELQPGDPKILLGRADALLASNRYEEALEAATKAASFAPSDGDALVARADALRMLGRFDEALADLNKASVLKPDDTRPLAAKGETLRLMRQWSEAEEVLRRVLEASPDGYSFAEVSLANVYLENNREREALDLVKRVTERSSEYVWAIETKARALLQLDHVEDGIAETDRLLGLQPEHAWACGAKGVLLFLKGDYAGAAAVLERSIALDAKIDWACSALAASYAWMSRMAAEGERVHLLEKGVAAGRRAVALSPDDLSWRTTLGDVLWLSGGDARREAQDLFRAVVDAAAKTPQLDFFGSADSGWAAFRLAGCGRSADQALVAEAERLAVEALSHRSDRPRSGDAIATRFDLALLMLCSDRVALAFREFDTARAYAIEGQEPAVCRALIDRARFKVADMMNDWPALKQSPYAAKAMAILQAPAASATV